jgi:hypothetical protein
MRYQTLTLKDVLAFAGVVTTDPSRANSTEAATFCAQYSGWTSSPAGESQREIDLAPLGQLTEMISSQMRGLGGDDATDANREKLEGAVAGDVHRAIGKIPVEILDDPRFWRYVAVRYFSEFIAWREKDALKTGGIAKYFTAAESYESIPLRIFLRAQAVKSDNDSYELTEAIPRGTDFWRSHILRVRTGRATGLTRSFVELQRDDRLKTKPLRELAKLVNRMWANVVLTEYSKPQAKSLLTELRDQIETEESH